MERNYCAAIRRKGDLIKVGAALVEFGEGAEADTGTIVGEVERSKPEAREAEAPSRRTEGCKCSLRFGLWRASSMLISTSCKAAVPAG